VIASLVTLLIPLWILLGLLVMLGVLAVLGRIKNGRYLRPLINLIAKVPLFRRWLQKASTAALERSNPELVSAMKKIEPHAKHMHDPRQQQKVMSRLTREERRALLDMQEQQGVAPEATNREMRRRLEKARKDAQKRR
jgi:hypothetical protein